MAIIYAFFAVCAVLFVIIGETIKLALSPFDGFAGDSGLSPWVLRMIFVEMSAFEVLTVILLFRTNRFMTARLKGDAQDSAGFPAGDDEPGIIHGRTHQCHRRLRPRLVSFPYGGERLDLYTFCAVSLALLFLLWPRRLEWEAMFREFSAKYPGIPSNPWQPEPSA